MNSIQNTVVLLVVTVVGPLSAAAQTVNLPETGQASVYDANASPRDDGAMRAGVGWPEPRFVDAGDGTLTDGLTGLVWLKESSCLGSRTWQTALDTIVDFNGGGDFGCIDYLAGSYSDWRLPNRNELESLGNAEESNPAVWLNSEGFLSVTASTYLSSTTYPAVAFAWTVDMMRFTTAWKPKTSSYGVWPVRATTTVPAQTWETGQTIAYDSNDPPRDDGALREGVAWPNPRFGENGDGTVTDNLTGLVWLADANCLASEYPAFDQDGAAGDGAVSWQSALDFVEGINDGTFAQCGAGYRDWRLANSIELRSLVDSTRLDPPLPVGHPFTGVQPEPYCSSTTDGYLASLAWSLHMNFGNLWWSHKVDDNCFVLPVRAGTELAELFTDGFESGDTSVWD